MNMSPLEKQRLANAVSGRTARACDSCLRNRARWYCAADDAFLCQACDSSVHSANLLALRHDRIRLKTTSYSPPLSDLNSNLPAWHQGFKRKARTPRHAKSAVKLVLLVPDLETLAADEKVEVEDEDEEQLLYRVPIFDPVLAEFCSPLTFDDVNISSVEEVKPAMSHGNFAGFHPSDIELSEFAADVENLLGQGLDDDSFCIDGLGLLEGGENDMSQVKTEMMDAIDTSREIISNNNTNFLGDIEMEFSRESLDFNFDCRSPITEDEVKEQKVEMVLDCQEQPGKIGLRMDYNAIIDAWSSCGCSPWTGGERPQFNLNDCWPDFMGMWGAMGGGGEIQGQYGLQIGQVGNGDGEREARVSRYREKRRTRLFSKKIRYEVRKLNAEKRPRMKGRFVKRTSFPTTTAPGGSAVFPYAHDPHRSS